jgi:heme-degrading monooxygenase HmoA
MEVVSPMADHFASGTWHVNEGSEDDFVQRWTELLEWTRGEFPGLVEGTLIHDRNDPGHYISLAAWADAESRDAWKQSGEFKQRMGACVALCDRMVGSDYDLAASV